jgi:hypothetical protein
LDLLTTNKKGIINMPNRSVNIYLLELGEQPGILSRIGGHLKRNWGKYALGGAAALAGGAALANPSLIAKAGQTVSTGLGKAANAITPAAKQLGQGATQPGLLSKLQTSVAGGLNTTARGVQSGANTLAAKMWELKNKIRPMPNL